MSTVKKGRILEALIAMIEKSIDGGYISKLERNKLVKSDIGIDREIDVYIEMKINNRIVRYGIECKNYKNPVKISEIDAFVSKCNQIKIDKKIFVTSSRYQSGAVELANSKGVDLCVLQLDKSLSLGDFDIKEIDVFKKSTDLLHIDAIIFTELQEEIEIDEPALHDSNKRRVTNTVLKGAIEESIWKNLIHIFTTNNGIILNYAKIVQIQVKCEGLQLKHKRKWLQIKYLNILADTQLSHKRINDGIGRNYKSVSDNLVLASLISTNIEINGNLLNVSIVKGNNKTKFVIDSSETEPIYFDIVKENNKDINFSSDPVQKIQYKNLLDTIPIHTVSYNLADSALQSVENNTVEENENKSFEKGLSENSILVSVNPQLKAMYFMKIEKVGKKLFAAKIPEPIKLFANYAIIEYNESDKIKMTFTQNVEAIAGQKVGILNDYTYHIYLQKKVSSVNMLRHSCFHMLNSLLDAASRYSKNESYVTRNTKAAISENISDKIDAILSTDRMHSIGEKYRDFLNEIGAVYDSVMNIQVMKELVKFPVITSFEVVMKYDLKRGIETFINFLSDYEKVINE